MVAMKSYKVFQIFIYYFLLLGPHICMSSTRVYLIESDKVCNPIKKKHIHLGRYNASSALLQETRYFDTWSGHHDFTCKIIIETEAQQQFPVQPKEGIFAVIQNLSLRKHWDTGECIDFIKFIHGTGQSSEEYCGEFAREDLVNNFLNSSGIPHNHAFIEPSGRMEVVIYIANQRLHKGDKIDFTIAFTAYKDCRSHDVSEQYVTCNQMLFEGSWLKHTHCIWKHFFNDSTINCPYGGCYEEPCVVNRVISSHGDGTAITVGSLASVILVFFVFICSLWICRKCQVLFWKPRTPRAPAVVHFSEDTAEEVVVQPSAPSISAIPEQHGPDKDPPPSYDSLFPPKPSS